MYNGENFQFHQLRAVPAMFSKNKILFASCATAILLICIIGGFYYFNNNRVSPIKIGVDLPQSGDFATFGILGIKGAQLAVDEINNNGGVLNGRPFELVIDDNQSDPNVAVRLMRKFIQEKDVFAILGPISSSARNAMLEVARQFKVPLLYGIDYEGGQFDHYLFCYSPIPDHVITPLMPYLAEHRGSKKFYVFGYDYEWPHGMAKAIQQEAERIGGHIVGIEFTPFGVQNYSRTFEKIRESGADTLILVMCGLDGQRFTKQFYHAGLKGQVQLVAIAAEESWEEGLSAEELEGVTTNVHFIRSLDQEDTRAFVSRLKKKFGDKTLITYSTESHYGLIMMLRDAIEKAGSTDDKEKIIAALENQRLTVGNGVVSMRADHHMNLNMIIATYHHGTLTAEKEIGLVKPKDQRAISQ